MPFLVVAHLGIGARATVPLVMAAPAGELAVAPDGDGSWPRVGLAETPPAMGPPLGLEPSIDPPVVMPPVKLALAVAQVAGVPWVSGFVQPPDVMDRGSVGQVWWEMVARAPGVALAEAVVHGVCLAEAAALGVAVSGPGLAEVDLAVFDLAEVDLAGAPAQMAAAAPGPADSSGLLVVVNSRPGAGLGMPVGGQLGALVEGQGSGVVGRDSQQPAAVADPNAQGAQCVLLEQAGWEEPAGQAELGRRAAWGAHQKATAQGLRT